MLGVSIHSNYLSFVATTDDGDSRVIDQVGVIDFPFLLDKGKLMDAKIVPDLINVFKELKNQLEFPQKVSYLSIDSELVSIYVSADSLEIPDNELKLKQRWEISTRVGADTYQTLNKNQVIINHPEIKSSVGIYYKQIIIDNIMEACEFVRLGLKNIDITTFSAYNAVQKNYDNSNYDQYCIMKILDNSIEMAFYSSEGILDYSKFAIQDKKPVFTTPYSKKALEAANFIAKNEFDNLLFEITGPIFAYASRELIMEKWEIIEQTYFMELINPFTNYSVFKRVQVLETDSELFNDSIFVECAGTLFRGMGDD